MKIKTDKLLVSAYVRHGDTCGLDKAHHDALCMCVSGHKAGDYVLVAKFAYLQEGIDYCHEGARRGCRMLLVSRITSEHLKWQYWPEGTKVEDSEVHGMVRVVKQSNVRELHRDI